MSAEENKNAVRRYAQEVVSQGNMAVFNELVAADYVEHTPAPGGSPDRDGLKRDLS